MNLVNWLWARFEEEKENLPDEERETPAYLFLKWRKQNQIQDLNELISAGLLRNL